MERKILPGLTTTPKSDWREKTQEINKLGLKEIALFPTFLEMDERKELYGLLEKTHLENIPHVHLRDDMEEWELDYYLRRWQSQVFNIHSTRAASDFLEKTSHKDIIFIENLHKIDEYYIKNVENSGGICIDFSHWQDQGKFQNNEGYDKFEGLIKKCKVGCCHISAIVPEPFEYIDPKSGKRMMVRDDHFLSDLSQLDYMKDYIRYLPQYVSMELENSFSKQLEVKEYLEKIINSVKSC